MVGQVQVKDSFDVISSGSTDLEAFRVKLVSRKPMLSELRVSPLKLVMKTSGCRALLTTEMVKVPENEEVLTGCIMPVLFCCLKFSF
jgi:hypothetical protein